MRFVPAAGHLPPAEQTAKNSMRAGIHPAYYQITVACGSCGNTFQIGSTQKEDMRVEVCSNCHPLYTGKSNLIDTAGRLDKFAARQKRAEELKAQEAKRAAKKADQAEEQAA